MLTCFAIDETRITDFAFVAPRAHYLLNFGLLPYTPQWFVVFQTISTAFISMKPFIWYP